MVKNSATNAGDVGSIPGLGRSPETGNGKPLQCSCLGNPVDRGACRATVHGFTVRHNLATQEQQPFNSSKFCFLCLGLCG